MAIPPARRTTRKNEAYSKRAMAKDLLALMKALGTSASPWWAMTVARASATAWRWTTLRPCHCLTVLDIVPTHAMWHNFTVRLAMKTYHWLFLAQPHPLPEMLIEQNPVGYLDYTIASWTKTKDLSAFSEEALSEYRHALRDARAHPRHLQRLSRRGDL